MNVKQVEMNAGTPVADQWLVPQLRLGDRDVPRLCLGDHGFLQRYGSRLTIAQIAGRMRHARSLATVGIAAGDERCLRAAQIAGSGEGSVPVVYHTDVRLDVGGRRIHFGRCMSSLYRIVRASLPEFLARDPIIGSFLNRYRVFRPYNSEEVAALRISRNDWTVEERRVHSFQPKVITLGGDWLDFAYAVGRGDLVVQALTEYKRICLRCATPLVVATYTAPITIGDDEAALPAGLYDGLMLPVNYGGLGMLPNREELLSWARRRHRPLVGMHVLGIARLPVESALSYAYDVAGISMAVVGASSPEHIADLIKAARNVI